jgi:hypothetical protein
MTKTVFSFRHYADNVHGLDNVHSLDIVHETCVLAMERGLLHVDATNRVGWTLGFMFVENSCTSFYKRLWDRYWGLRPDVSLFWHLVYEKVQFLCTTSQPRCVMWHLREALCNTPALWADLALVQPVARKCVFIQEQVHARIRESCRFAWIAAVVQ